LKEKRKLDAFKLIFKEIVSIAVDLRLVPAALNRWSCITWRLHGRLIGAQRHSGGGGGDYQSPQRLTDAGVQFMGRQRCRSLRLISALFPRYLRRSPATA